MTEHSEGTQKQGRAKDGKDVFSESSDCYSDVCNWRILVCEVYLIDWCLLEERLGVGTDQMWSSGNGLVCFILLRHFCLFLKCLHFCYLIVYFLILSFLFIYF